MGAQCPVSQLNDTFFPTGRPPYLSTPAQHPSDDTVCPQYIGNLSCCSTDTLSDISAKFTAMKNQATSNMTAQITKLDNIFTNMSRIDYAAVVGGVAGDRLRLIFAKLIANAKVKFAQLKVVATSCFSAMFRVQAGFLCAACSTTFPVNVTGSARPKIRIKDNTLTNMTNSCQDYSTQMKDVVDEYHRVKAQIVDYLTGEIGQDSDDCTCTGEKINTNNSMSFDFTGVPPASNRRLLEAGAMNSTIQGNLDSFTNEIRKPRADPPPNMGGNQTDNAERQADAVLTNDTKNLVNPKTMKRRMFADVKSLAFGLYLKISRSLNFRAYANIRKDLQDLLKLKMFSFDEGFAIAVNLANSFQNWTTNWFSVRQVFGKMAVDFLLNIPWSTGQNANVAPTTPVTNGSAAPRQFNYQFSFYYAVRDYARKLNILLQAINDQGVMTMPAEFPYLQNNVLKTENMSAGTTVATLLAKEKGLFLSNGILLMPVLQFLSLIENAMNDLAPKAVNFATTYLTKLTDDDKRYIRDTYFTPAHYRVNPQDLKISANVSDLAKQTIAYYNTTITNSVLSGFRNCLDLVQNKSQAAANFITNILLAARRDRPMDGARRLSDSIGEAGAMIIQTCETNRQRIKLYKNCSGPADCFVCFMDRKGVITQVNVTAGTTISDIDKVLGDARRAAGLMAKMDIMEMMPYDDDDEIEIGKCARMISARTKLCVPLSDQQTLQMNPLDDPPAIDDTNIGGDMLSSAMNKRKFSVMSNIANPQEKPLNSSRLLLADNDEVDFSTSDSGVDLSSQSTGLNTAATVTTTSSSATTIGAFLATCLIAILLLI